LSRAGELPRSLLSFEDTSAAEEPEAARWVKSRTVTGLCHPQQVTLQDRQGPASCPSSYWKQQASRHLEVDAAEPLGTARLANVCSSGL